MQKTLWLVGLLWLSLSGPAYAHSPVPGIEGFYIGLLHPFSTPSQAIVLIGLGLLVSSLRQDQYAKSLGAFPCVMLVTLFLGASLDEPDTALFAFAAAACSIGAMWPRPALPAVVIVIAIGGVMMGLVSIPDPGPAQDRIITMAGSFVGANLGLLYISGAVVFLKDRYPQHWVGIAFRVASAWAGAIALVMLALQFAETSSTL